MFYQTLREFKRPQLNLNFFLQGPAESSDECNSLNDHRTFPWTTFLVLLQFFYHSNLCQTPACFQIRLTELRSPFFLSRLNDISKTYKRRNYISCRNIIDLGRGPGTHITQYSFQISHSVFLAYSEYCYIIFIRFTKQEAGCHCSCIELELL